MAITINGNGTLSGVTAGLTASSLPSGSILQVVSATKTDEASTTSTTSTEISSDLRVTLTPNSSSSKIFITMSIYISQADSAQTLRLYRDIGGGGYNAISTSGSDAEDGTNSHWAGDGGAFMAVMNLSFLDSPNTTSAVIYTPYWRISGNTCYLNRGYGGSSSYNGTSTVTAMEVAG